LTAEDRAAAALVLEVGNEVAVGDEGENVVKVEKRVGEGRHLHGHRRRVDLQKGQHENECNKNKINRIRR